MLDHIKRFDMKKAPMRPHLAWLIYLLSWFALKKHKNTITKKGVEGLRPPYLLLCNHNAFMDFKVASHAIYPHKANFVVAIDGFIGREWLLRFIGAICTRKFVSDPMLVRHLMEVVRRGGIPAIYPEARYSLCGTTAYLPPSLGKLCKLLKVPVVTLMCHGHHVNSPFYHLPDHGVKGTEATLSLLFTAEETKSLSVEEINRRLREAFWYDDFAWQRERGIKITYPDRAKGLHKVLYQCPACQTEYRMDSDKDLLFCKACGKKWRLGEYGALSALEGETEFSHVPDWYEWERANVRREVEEGTYGFEGKAHLKALPNAKGYIDMGEVTLKHSLAGFRVEGMDGGEPFTVEIPARIQDSCHIEYEYLGKYGDCIDLNTRTDTLYIYPSTEEGAPGFSVTKFALATEEIYRSIHQKDKS